MALDILPVAGASTGVESLFSRAKQVATDRRSTLDPDVFEHIECLHYNWKRDLVDYSRVNSEEGLDMELEEYAFWETQEVLLKDDD